MASSHGTRATLEGGKGEDVGSPQRVAPTTSKYENILSSVLRGDRTPVSVLNKTPNVANKTKQHQLTSLYQPAMSSKLPTNFRKVSYCENRFSALLGISFCCWKFRYLTSLSTATS